MRASGLTSKAYGLSGLPDRKNVWRTVLMLSTNAVKREDSEIPCLTHECYNFVAFG